MTASMSCACCTALATLMQHLGMSRRGALHGVKVTSGPGYQVETVAG
jgi:hypothetical protein